MSVTINSTRIRHTLEEVQFLKIGENAEATTLSNRDFKRSKRKKINDIWGTLGWADDSNLELEGDIEFSEDEGLDESPVVSQIAEVLAVQNNEIRNVDNIRKRFIDLSKLNFQNLPEEISDESELTLRFDLFLGRKEGALVFLQNSPKEDEQSTEDSFIHFITPEATNTRFWQRRYRLTYLFPYLFGREAEYDGEKLILKGPQDEVKTVIKILTFKRKHGRLKKYLKSVVKNLNNSEEDIIHQGLHKLGNKKYALYKFNSAASESNPGGEFVDITKEVKDTIDEDAKSLIMFHGTFSTTEKSFGEFLDLRVDNESKSLLQEMVDQGKYEQILAFNHPTASQSPYDNINKLFGILGKTKFTNYVDVITSSRGALLAEVLSGFEKAKGRLELNKVMMFAPANGSALLIAAKGFDRLLSIAQKLTTSSGVGYLLALAQFSVQKIRTQPGLEAMMPGSDMLTKILATNPIKQVEFKAMVGDWDKKLVKKRWLRVMAIMLDAPLKLLFKGEHDWVIGCAEQRLKVKGNNMVPAPNTEYKSVHGKYFEKDYPLDNNGQPIDVFSIIDNYL